MTGNNVRPLRSGDLQQALLHGTFRELPMDNQRLVA